MSGNDLKDTDRCVMCGLCLPHCPTYGLTRDEGDSPRGRIALIQALDRGEMEASSARLRYHLDRCLECRACEAMCPSGVPFGPLMDAARARLEDARERPAVAGWARQAALSGILPRRGALRATARALRFYQNSGLRRLARGSGLLRRLGLARADAALPDLSAPARLRAYYAPAGAHQGDVALFSGCMGEIADAETLGASITVLNRLGFGVRVPRDQGCCGALHQHNGDPGGAARLARRNIETFRDASAVIGTATGCTAMLAEYGRLAGLEGEAGGFAGRVTDITTFLARQPWPAAVKLAPLGARVAVHIPCSLRNVLRDPQAPRTLLERIPDIELVAVTEDNRCCGAAGSYMLTEPDMADALLEHQVEALRRRRPALVTTANVGCGLHLRAGLRRAGMSLEVVHPVVLLARQLR